MNIFMKSISYLKFLWLLCFPDLFCWAKEEEENIHSIKIFFFTFIYLVCVDMCVSMHVRVSMWKSEDNL